MRKSSLVAASMVILAFGCSDATNPTAPESDAGPRLATAPTAQPALAALTAILAPDPADRILLDTRTTLQQATSYASAKAAFGTNIAANGNWGFTSNVDGSGTNAMRLIWPRRYDTACRYATASLGVPLPTPRATRIYVQWKQHLGRTETGGGSGPIGGFTMGNGCTADVRAKMTALRAGLAETERLEYRWMAPTPLAPRVTAFVDPSTHVDAGSGSTFRPVEHAGTTITQTLYLQAESAPGARDGVVRLWVNGTLVMERAGVAIGAAGFRRLRFPGRMAIASRLQTEYFWDVVAWEPAAETPPSNPAPVATVNVTPAAGTLSIGSNLQLVATLLDANGDTIRDRPVTWQSSAPEIASVGIDGVAVGVATGSATITATAEGRSGTAALTVQQVPVAAISIAPTAPAVDAGKTVQLAATVRDANGNVLTGRTITWETSAAGIATVSSTGLVSGIAAGTATITASSEGKSATVDVTVRPPAPVAVASVTIAPETATIDPGATQQLSATMRDASGAVLTGRSVAWQSLNTAVATVSSSGLVTGVSAGTARIRATSETVADTATITVTAPPVPANGVADPTLLPRATSQRPVAGSYGRTLAAGQTYVDPNSGVTVLKLTSASVPTANGGMYHGYSEGGPNISQAWTGTDGQTYYTVKISEWLVDIRYSTLTPVNWRRVTYDGEIGLAFSMNPATPRIAYLVNGKRVDRYNTATNAIENTGNWPWIIAAAGTSPQWLQTQMNDTWIVAMLQSNFTVVAFRPSDGFQRAVTPAQAGVAIDEPHLDREFPVVYLSGDSPIKNKMVNLETGAFRTPNDPGGIGQDSHGAPLRGKLVAQGHWAANAIVATDITGRVWPAISPTPTDVNGDYHLAGQWVFNNPAEYFVADQWASSGNNAIYKGMIGFVSMAGDVRLLAAHDALGTSYAGGQPHPTLAQDGKLVMWTTNMGGSARHDTFIARVPVR